VAALIIRGAGRSFVAGADVTEFHGSPAKRIEEIARLNIRLFDAIENLKIPVIAVLDGFTLGGGNELAMSAHYRIVTENTRIGQPEVNWASSLVMVACNACRDSSGRPRRPR